MRSLEKIDQQLVAAVCHNVTIGYTVRESAGVRAKLYYLIAKLKLSVKLHYPQEIMPKE